ncbi:hypothetical protein M408DRAFT_27691 [Serendipita vermifera MAFF 305830]|uniref:Uncharacterized protein n=1 Tax=Serendipita vermifera MAFF 305830 TaxID=933852 RepID=A0A0C3AGG8_SERVB|nr:hypothetical protein M408DRAFT_27691 [Serendipita vermifera MAFF 305830]
MNRSCYRSLQIVTDEEIKDGASLYYGLRLANVKFKMPTHVCKGCFHQTNSSKVPWHHMEKMGMEDKHAHFLNVLEPHGDGIEAPVGYELYCLKADGNPALRQA